MTTMMMMKNLKIKAPLQQIILSAVFLTFVSSSTLASHVSYRHINTPKYVNEACSVTQYREICIHSLSPFSNVAKRSPYRWARAGISVTIKETKGVINYLRQVKQHGYLPPGRREHSALLDCVEVFDESLDSLHKSLGLIRSLKVADFRNQMGDLLTWLSAAETDSDTCLEGFEDIRAGSREIDRLKGKVSRVGYFTSNALALTNRLASTGLKSVGRYD